MNNKDILNGILYGGGGSAPSGSVTITQNGTYNVADKASAIVSVQSQEDALLNGTIETYSNPSITEVRDKVFSAVGPNMKTVTLENVTTMGKQCFYGCTKLESISMPKLTTMGTYNFYNCSNLESVYMPELLTMGECGFENCTNLVNVYMPKYRDKVGGGSAPFRNCSSLVKLHLPSFIGVLSAFVYKCSALEEIEVGSPPSIENTAFINCPNIKTLIIRGESVTQLLRTQEISSTKIPTEGYVYVPASVIDQYKAASGWSDFASRFRALEDYTIDGTATGELDPEKV